MSTSHIFPQRSQGDSTESEGGAPPNTATSTTMNVASTLEERRRSLLDQHWAIPSKDRSLEDQDSNGSSQETPVQAPICNIPQIPESSEPVSNVESRVDDATQMVKQSCYDSGIDMREPVPPPIVVPPVNTKKVGMENIHFIVILNLYVVIILLLLSGLHRCRHSSII